MGIFDFLTNKENTPNKQAIDVNSEEMLEHIKEYLLIQISILRELEHRGCDLWQCHEDDVLGWYCYSHGEHICCENMSTDAQLEIPLLSINNTGIDTGHFKYYLETIGVNSPSYSNLTEILENFELNGILVEVQTNDRPIIWDIKRDAS